VTNLSRKVVTLQQLSLRQWTCAHNVMPELPPVLRSVGKVIPKRSIGELSFSVQLNDAAIRRIVQSAQAARNTMSSPQASISADGALLIRESHVPIAFRLDVYWPQLNFYWDPTS
jgi:hypothetical protein